MFVSYSSGPATPYKVSVFPWAVADDSENQSLEICSTSTPPNSSFGVQETEDWPPPPTEEEINGSTSNSKTTGTRTKNSPHVPPPPPPRSESLTPRKKTFPSPVVADIYADPYDKLSSTSNLLKKKSFSDYQEPVNEVIRINTRTQPDNPRLVLQSFSQNEEPDTSLYCKPINKEALSKPDLSSNSKDNEKIAAYEDMKSHENSVTNTELYSQPPKTVTPRSSDLEDLYSKPLKKKIKQNEVTNSISAPQRETKVEENDSVTKVSDKQSDYKSLVSVPEDSQLREEKESELYSEIMQHFRKVTGQTDKLKCKPDPIYETIDDCLEKLNSETKTGTNLVSINKESQEKQKTDSKIEDSSGLLKMKKKTVLAASSDKIYETYLSLRGNPNVLKSKGSKQTKMSVPTNNLSKKFKSQPDISFSENSENKILFENIETQSKMEEITASNPTINCLEKHSVAGNKYSNDGTNYVHLTVAQRAQSFENGFKDSECPGTPIITATPSFDSLCAVTPLSKRSGSSQSLPAQTGSLESLSAHESNMSVSSRSTLSTVPDEDESRLCESFEDENATPIATYVCSSDSKKESAEPEKLDSKNRTSEASFDDNAIKEKFANGNIPITPGKISAAKHGIDLSVYILKPVKQDPSSKIINSESLNADVKNIMKENTANSDIKVSSECGFAHKILDTHARLAIKENLSGSKTNMEPSKSTGKKEQGRRHTVQTVHEMKVNGHQKTGTQSSVPSIGIASKAFKAENVSKPGKSKFKQSCRNENEAAVEPDSKRLCVGGTKVIGHGDDLYLETDIDTVIAERGRQNLKKSKSHSSVGSSTVVTEIW